MGPNLVKSLLWPILSTGSYTALGNFMRRIVMVGCMHFMDPYNFDIDRVQQCVIHYGLPDGTIRPFCSMNSIHRSNIEKEYSVPYDEFLKKKRESKLTAK